MENLRDDLELLKTNCGEDCEIKPEEFVDIDLDFCVNNKLIDEDIFAEVSGYKAKFNGEIDANDVDDANDEIVKPSWNETTDAINILDDYSLFSNFGVDLRNALTDIDRIVDKDERACKKQTAITYFFLLRKENQ